MPVFHYQQAAPRVRPKVETPRGTSQQDGNQPPEDHKSFEELCELSDEVYAHFAASRGIVKP